MTYFKIIIVMFFSINSILGRKRCDLTDNQCVRRGAMATYPLFIKGIENLVDPSDPLVLDTINVDSSDIVYKLQNAKFSGMKDCVATILMLNEKERTFQYHLECPYIEMTADYTLSMQLSGTAIEGSGSLKMTSDKYGLKFDGVYDKTIGKDDKEHVTIKSYNLDVDANGNVVYEISNLKENSEAIHKYFNDNWNNKVLLQPIHAFIKVFTHHLNEFMKLVPTDEVFSDLS